MCVCVVHEGTHDIDTSFLEKVNQYAEAAEMYVLLDAAEHEPLFLSLEQLFSFSFHKDVSDRVFRFFEHVENDLDAEEILEAYEQRWDNMVLDCWARKHGIELLPNPDLESIEAHEEDLAWRKRMEEEHPNINLDYPLTVDQDEVNRFPDVFVSQMPRPFSNQPGK